MSTRESNTYSPVQTWSQNKKTRNYGLKKFPFTRNVPTSLRASRQTVKTVKTADNTLVPLGKQPKNSIITVAYMYSFVLKDVTKLKVLYTQKKIDQLMDDYYWWEDDVMNTFLCILSSSFHDKYSNSIIHLQVIVVYFSELDQKIYANLMLNNEHFFRRFPSQ